MEDDRKLRKSDRKEKRRSKRISRLFDDIKAGAVIQVERRISKVEPDFPYFPYCEFKTILIFLLQKPKLLLARDHRGRRALHVASSSGSYQICSLLLRRSADVNCADEAGNTALHSAAKEEKWAIAELLISKGALRDIKNTKGKTPSSYGLDEALAEIHMEEERLAQKQEWIAEERSKFRRDVESPIAKEREWREKLLDEHNFEYIEGAGYGSEQRTHAHGGVRMDGWFADEEEALDDDDWWAAIARQMRRRHCAFSDDMGAHGASNASRPAPPPPPERPAFQGIGEDARMAWERKWAKEGHRPASSAPAGAAHDAGNAARAAAHALAWERFITKYAGAGGDEAAGVICFDNVPWPAPAAGGDVAEEAMMLPAALRNNADARRRAVREALRRWHPDKFGQRFGGRLAAADRERILERVKAVSQALTALVQ